MITVYRVEEIDAAILKPLGWTDGTRWLKRRIADGRVPGKRLSRNVFVMTDKHLDEWLNGDATSAPKLAASEVSEPAAEPAGVLYGLSARSARRIKQAPG